MLFFKHRYTSLSLILGCMLSFSASAHFQLLYTPNLLRAKGGEITLKMPFTHPAASGFVMKMEKPLDLYMVKRGKKTDLTDKITPMKWTSAVDQNDAFEANAKLHGLGDYVFILQPVPYFEAEEDLYILQFTKTIVNVGNLPTNWDKDLGLTAEIVPLTKPYAIYEGGIFSGVVKSSGKPVPFAAVEVEFMNYTPNLQKNEFAKSPIMTPPAEVFVTQTIHADANGTFHFSLLKAGQWGFAALGIGKKKTYKGKNLSQDAVIWVQATKLP